MKRSIVFTGGGTAGHVTPNVALIRELKQEGWEVSYIGSLQGMEREMMRALAIPFYAVSTGKLRRYFSLKTLFEPLKVFWGILQAMYLLYRLKPNVVFSKGGFVAFPVVVGAWLNRIPVVAHESDMSPGLANRLSFPFVNKICLTFEEGKKHLKRQDKIEVTGTPIRQELFTGNRLKGLELCGFNTEKPCLLVIGGSLGSERINQSIRTSLEGLTQAFQIIHLCGKGKVDASLSQMKGYCQLEYAHEELAHLFAASSLVISRSGANALYELLALVKPHILIPLSAQVSRGDQIQNAAYFEKLGISAVIQESALNQASLLEAIHEVMAKKESLCQKMMALDVASATEKIVEIIKRAACLS